MRIKDLIVRISGFIDTNDSQKWKIGKSNCDNRISKNSDNFQK